MKILYTKLLAAIFLLAWAMPTHAQTPLLLGSKADLVEKFNAQNKNARASTVRQELPDNESLELQINLSNKTDKGFVFGGQVTGHKNATFSLVASEDQVSGYIILREQKKAYEYYTQGSGAAYLKEVDIDGVLCVEYENHSKQGYAEKSEGEVQGALAVPMLESLPGSSYVVLLDFDGQTVTSPHWNGGTTINAAPANLTDAEAVEVWKLIAEDFRPWDLNITTNEAVFNAVPPSQRMRMIFTPTDDAYPGAGGVAYVGSFTAGDDYPCWVFNSGIKAAGEAGSHEVGHTVGLRHDGTTAGVEYYAGNDDWAPIMGVGYYVTTVQWSKGEYPNANNPEDDLNIISTQNGFGYRGDDHGNTNGGATPLISAPSGTVSASDNKGIITTRTDVDVFSFTTGAGTITLDANPNPDFPNLDIMLTLKDAGGTTVATADPTSLSASISQAVGAGTYYLHVEGVQGDKGAHSDYASIGEFSISGYIVNDVTPPVLVGVPANTTASCDDVPDPATVTATDNIDGSVAVSYNQSITLGSCAGNYSITRTWSATDAAGNTASASQIITVTDNTGPVLTGVPEGLSFSVADGRCEAEIYYPVITATDNCSSTTLSFSPASGSTFPLGITTVTVNAVDECGNMTTSSFEVEITNDAPVISSITAPLDPQPVNTVVNTSALFVDNNLATASWDWGDGSPASAGVISGNTITGSHTYTGAGVYTLTLSLEDACGATASDIYQYVVVYDPSAGFVTGGGWIYSPPGAYVPEPLAEGKASFGFVSKYKKGATAPDGTTDFEFRAGDLSFKSTAYEWLVIANHKAMYKGIGSVNGVEGYGFLLSAVDGKIKGSDEPDRFRIQIWDALENTVYDNQMGDDLDAEATMALEGGSIVIHSGKGKSSSSAMEASIGAEAFTNLAAYPNPLQGEGLWLEIPVTEHNGLVKASIYDLSGRIMAEKVFAVEKEGGRHLWTINHAQWSDGVYLLMIKGDNGTQQLRLLK